MRLLRSGLSVVGVLALASVVLAQSRQPISLQEQRKMIVSARAGGVNLVEGDVTAKSGDADWALLVAGDELKSGTSVRTGANSRAEILLDPGSYLRLSSNSEFKFEDTSSDNLRLAVLRGSAIVEEGAAGHWRGTLAIVATPKAVFNIVRSGVYRFDVDENGAAQVEVQKGKLAVASGAAGSSDVLVPEGKKAVLASSSPEVAGFSKRDLDGFDAWSKDRAKSLVEANNTMVNPSVGPAFLAGAISPLYSGCGGWWAFDPFFGSSIYLPGGFDSCSSLFSPYGWYYGVCNYPTVGYGQEPGEGGTPATHHHRHITPAPGKILPGGPVIGASPTQNHRTTGSNTLGISRGGRGAFGGFGSGRGWGGGSGFGSGGSGSVSVSSRPMSHSAGHSSTSRGH